MTLPMLRIRPNRDVVSRQTIQTPSQFLFASQLKSVALIDARKDVDILGPMA